MDAPQVDVGAETAEIRSPVERCSRGSLQPIVKFQRLIAATVSLRVLSRNCRGRLARKGPIGAAIELPGGCRRRAPTSRSGRRRSNWIAGLLLKAVSVMHRVVDEVVWWPFSEKSGTISTPPE